MRAVFGRIVRTLLLAGLFAVGTPALADDAKPAPAAIPGGMTEQEARNCASDNPDISIATCSAVIDRGDAMASNVRALAYFMRGVSYNRKGDIDAALADWTAALVFRPDPMVVDMTLRKRADVLSDQKRYKEAIADYSKLIELNPKDINVLLLRSTQRALALDFDGALADASQAIALDPKRSESHYVLAHVSFLHKDYEAVTGALDKAIALDTSHGEYFAMRGTARLFLGDLDGARSDFEKGAGLNPKLELSFAGLGQVARLTGDGDGAVEALTRGIAASPDSLTLYADRANLLIETGHDADATADLDKEIAINGKILTQPVLTKDTRSEVLANRAYARALRGDNEQAIADAEEALGLDPYASKAYDARGIAYVRKGDYARAISDFSQALGNADSPVSVTLHRAEAHQAFGNYALAIEDYKAVLAIAPNFPIARDALAAAQEALKSDPVAATPPDQADSARPPVATAQTGPGQIQSLGKRVALVIGNGSYAKFGQLPNPKRDAEKIAQTFRDVGFTKVSIAEDLTNESFNEVLHQFAADADGADWAVIYYAGHGIEIDNKNYLIPVDAKLASDRDVAFETVPLERVTAALDGVKGMRLVILDACRENPFAAAMTKTTATRSIGQGLAQVEPESGTLVAYSAKAGQVAQDGSGENSPFVLALDGRIRTPGLEIGKLFRLVRDDVLAATGNVQEPFTYGSLSGADLFINPAPSP